MPLKIFPVSLQIQLQTTPFQQRWGEDAGATNHDGEQKTLKKQNPQKGKQCVCSIATV